ncbi:neurogenic locus notch homolog protein 4-like [Branchiostoma floridae]|uniref:Neurogenic locus notch homolog protein 4-like n=1 Tax=Branchiostoma floridae TaxID=7739 RepID=A0A9J7KXE2_BRAFL|nr:neurogenic locus notch homolog protein 4-like [Branchiostoma floridae]
MATAFLSLFVLVSFLCFLNFPLIDSFKADLYVSADNAPPIFEPTSIIIAFIDNLLDFTVEAEDPENRPHLTYSLVGAPPDPDLSLSSDGQLTWTPKQNSTLVVNVMAADECSASSTQSLTVMARDCPCQNGGSCPPFALDSPDNINCTCNGTGFTGQMCDVDVDECLNSPCDHGVCNNTVGGFHCECEQYYTGPLCDQETPCFSYRCPDNGTCADIPGAIQCTICPEESSGNSSLCVVIEISLDPCSSNPCYHNVTCDVLDDVYTCGPCPAGMTGDGVECVKDVTELQGSSWYQQPVNIALLSVGAVTVAAALIGVAVWRVKSHNATRGKVGDLPLEERRKSHPSQDLHVEEMSDQDDKVD